MSFDPISNNLVGKLVKQHLLGTPTKRIGGRDNLDPHFLSGNSVDVDHSSKLASIFEEGSVYNERAWMCDVIPDTYTTITSEDTRVALQGTRVQFRDTASDTWVVAGLNATGMFIRVSDKNGVDWSLNLTDTTVVNAYELLDVQYFNGYWYVLTTTKLYRSNNPKTTAFSVVNTAVAPVVFNKIKYLNGDLIITCTQAKVIYSENDGTTWKDGFIGHIHRYHKIYAIRDIEYDHITKEYIVLFDDYNGVTEAYTPLTAPNTINTVKLFKNITYIIKITSFKNENQMYVHINYGPESTTNSVYYGQSNYGWGLFKLDNKILISTYRGYMVYTCGSKSEIKDHGINATTLELRTISNCDHIKNIWKYKEYYFALSCVEINHHMTDNTRGHVIINVSKDLITWRPFEVAYFMQPTYNTKTSGITSAGATGLQNQFCPLISDNTPIAITEYGSILNLSVHEDSTSFNGFQVNECVQSKLFPENFIFYGSAQIGNTVVRCGGNPSATQTVASHLYISEDGGLNYKHAPFSATNLAAIGGSTGTVAIDITTFNNKFYISFLGKTGLCSILSSSDGKNWTMLVSNIQTNNYAKLFKLDDKLYFNIKETTTNKIRIYQITNTDTVPLLSETPYTETATNFPVTTRVVKFNNKYYFMKGGVVFSNSVLTSAFTAVATVDTSVKNENMSEAIVFNNALIFFSTDSLFYTTDGTSWVRRKLSSECNTAWALGNTTVEHYGCVRDAVVDNGMLIIATNRNIFTLNSISGVIKCYYTPFIISHGIFVTEKYYCFHTTGGYFQYPKKKLSADEFFQDNWMLYGYEEINSNTAGQVTFDDASSEYQHYNIVRNYANGFDYPRLSRAAGSFNGENNCSRLYNDQVSILDADYEEKGCTIQGYTYSIVPNTTRSHIVHQYRNSDPVYIPIDTSKFGIQYSPLTYHPINNEIYTISNPATSQTFVTVTTPGSNVVSYIDVSSWINSNFGGSPVISGFQYFAEKLYLFIGSKCVVIKDIRNIATSSTIIDLPAIYGAQFSTDVFIRHGELVDDELWCIARPARGIRNNVMPTALFGVGSIIAFRADGSHYLLRSRRSFYRIPENDTYNNPNEIINSPTVRFIKVINRITFAYGYNRDINYYEIGRLKAIPNICKPIVKSPNTETDPYAWSTSTFFDINEAGTEIIAKTGTMWYKARKPQKFKSHDVINITNYFKVTPMGTSNGNNFTMCDTCLSYIGNDSFAYIVQKNNLWETDFIEGIKSATYIKTNISCTTFNIEMSSVNDVIVFSQRNPTTGSATLFLATKDGVYKQFTVTETNPTFVTDTCVVNDTLYIAFNQAIYKIPNYLNPASTPTRIILTSNAACPIVTFETLKYDEVLNMLITCGRAKSDNNSSIASVDLNTGVTTKLHTIGFYALWELYRHDGWTYLSGLGWFGCTFRTRDYKVFYPIRHHHCQTDQVHYGAGSVNNRYLISQAVNTKSPSIVDLQTNNISVYTELGISNSFIKIIPNTNNVLAFVNTGSVYLLTEKTEESVTNDVKRLDVVDQEYLPINISLDNYVGRSPYAIRYLKADGTNNDVGTTFNYVNGVYFIFSTGNSFCYSTDLNTWTTVTLDSSIYMGASSSSSTILVAYNNICGWIIQCTTINGSYRSPALLYGANLHGLTLKSLETKATPVTFNAPLGLDVSSKGMYFTFVYEVIYLATVQSAPVVVVTSSNSADANYFSKIGLPALAYMLLLNTNDRRRVYTKSNKLNGFYISYTNLSFLYREDNTNVIKTLYTLKGVNGHTPKFAYTLHGNFFMLFGNWSVTDPNTTDNTRIIAVNAKNITHSTPLVNQIPPFDPTYRVVGLAQSNEVAVICAQNSNEIKASIDGITWVTVAVIPDTLTDIKMPVGIVYNDIDNVFSVFMSDTRIFNIDPLGNNSPLIMKEIINT